MLRQLLGLGTIVAITVVLTLAVTQRLPRLPSARCHDGSLSYSAHTIGTCSGHSGVAEWINRPGGR